MPTCLIGVESHCSKPRATALGADHTRADARQADLDSSVLGFEVDRPSTPGVIKAERPGEMRFKSLRLCTLPHGRLPMSELRRATQAPEELTSAISGRLGPQFPNPIEHVVFQGADLNVMGENAMSIESNHGADAALEEGTLMAIQAFLANDLDAVPPAEILRAIQRDAHIELDDDEIAYVLQDAHSQCMSAQMTAARLLRLGRGLPSYEAKPRPK